MTGKILESRLVAEIVRHLPRRPATKEPTEAALVDFDPDGESFLAVAADSPGEELATGLYRDPYTIGWVLAISPASDLAAAGARLIGLALVLNLPPDLPARQRTALARGIGDACRALKTIVLGGDTNLSPDLAVGAFAVGLVSKNQVVSRRGARPGDGLYLSAPAGLGNAYALARFVASGQAGAPAFRPRPPMELGLIVRGYASCAMDTSDGVVSTLDELARVNAVGFALTAKPAAVLCPQAIRQCRRRGIPPWLALAGCHGEFELVFTIPPQREKAFLREASNRRFSPIRIGHVTRQRELALAWGSRPVPIDAGWIRNQSGGAARDVAGYIRSLVQYAGKVGPLT